MSASLKISLQKHSFTISKANLSSKILPPNASTFASLCFLLLEAISTLVHKAALICGNLFAAIEIPIPVPQKSIPLELFLSFIFLDNIFAKSG